MKLDLLTLRYDRDLVFNAYVSLHIKFHFQANAASKIIVEMIMDENWKIEIPVAETLQN